MKQRICKRCLGKFTRWGTSDDFPNRPPVTNEVKAMLESFLLSNYAAEGGPFPKNLKDYKYLKSLCDECLYYTMWQRKNETHELKEEKRRMTMGDFFDGMEFLRTIYGEKVELMTNDEVVRELREMNFRTDEIDYNDAINHWMDDYYEERGKTRRKPDTWDGF